MNQVFGNLSAVELFIKERVIFIHENANGFYRISSYFTAKVFCDLLPMRLIPTVLFCAIVYFMIGKNLALINNVIFNLSFSLYMTILKTNFTCTFCHSFYPITGFQTDVDKFFIFTLTVFSVGFCAAALGWLFSATVSVFAIANLLIALCYVFMMVSYFGAN